ncbi:VC_2705 family sodium/solute symporter, partial [Oscillochloris sp. ZM17-4]|uniref:VC_2705 family sodium/solute symporter n=1 Tax=Oscillochloris sp. ZM17-4 TaxID=2866714 RepID=UPI001C7328F1
LDGYWRANLRLIGPYLLIWLISFTLPSILAAPLNQISVLTGFPLGYYMGAQGSLIFFILLTFLYGWRMRGLDRQYGLDTPAGPEERARRRRIFGAYAGFVAGFVLLVVAVGMLDMAFHIPVSAISWFFLLLTIGIYAVIGLRSRTTQLDEYYVAGRRVPGMLNGLATGSDWMSAASFISMAGALYLLGYEGLAYITGWTGGYVLLVLLLAPYLRKFGQFTIPDFIGARYPGAATRVISAVISIIISFTYVTAQVTGVGIIMSRFLGVNYMLGVIVGLSAVLLCSFLGGMQAITWTQGVQGIILVIAYLVPVTWISLKITGVPLPQLMYGQAMHQIEVLEAAQGIQSYSQPFNDWTPWNFVALTLCLMLGTAGMPHILVRFYTVPDVGEARSSVSWALAWICVLYLTAPAYAAFSRLEILQDVVNKPIAELPQWAENWAATGLLSIADAPEQGGNGDGRLQFRELQIDQDLVVLATPEIAGLPGTVVALVAAGGMAAALSTADGLLMVIASAAAHDILHRTLNPKATQREQMLLSRIMVLTAAILAALTAIQRLAIIVQMVAWAFSLAAACFFPVLVLGIFWKGATSRGAAAGMIGGLAVTAAYMVISYTFPDRAILGISHSAAGIFGVPVNFLVVWFISKLDPAQPSAEMQSLVDSLRQPGV